MVSKVFLLTKIKPEYSDILYNLTHFPGPLMCLIRQVLLYMLKQPTSTIGYCPNLLYMLKQPTSTIGYCPNLLYMLKQPTSTIGYCPNFEFFLYLHHAMFALLKKLPYSP